MRLPALQNQHGICFRTEEEKQNYFLFYLFLILCTSLQNDCLELGKMRFNVQGVAHNPVLWIENNDWEVPQASNI